MAVCGSARFCHPYLYAARILTQPAIDHGARGRWGQRCRSPRRILRKRKAGASDRPPGCGGSLDSSAFLCAPGLSLRLRTPHSFAYPTPFYLLLDPVSVGV